MSNDLILLHNAGKYLLHHLPTIFWLWKLHNPFYATGVFSIPPEISRKSVFLIISGDIERDQWYEMGKKEILPHFTFNQKNFILTFKYNFEKEFHLIDKVMLLSSCSNFGMYCNKCFSRKWHQYVPFNASPKMVGHTLKIFNTYSQMEGLW